VTLTVEVEYFDFPGYVDSVDWTERHIRPMKVPYFVEQVEEKNQMGHQRTQVHEEDDRRLMVVMACVCVRDDGRISGWRGCTRDWSVSVFCMWKWLTTNTFDCMLTARPLTGITVFCCVCLFVVARWNGADHYIFALWFLLLSIYLSFFFSSPNLSRRRLDVCHTSTHAVALVRI